MTKKETEYDLSNIKINVLNIREAVQKRPGMYLGGTGLFAQIRYLMSAFHLLVGQGASKIQLSVHNELFEVEADVGLAESERPLKVLPIQKRASPSH